MAAATFTFSPMTDADARAIASWRYEGPSSVYGMGSDQESRDAAVAELLDRRSPHFAVRDEHGELVGFFGFGTAAEVSDEVEPALWSEDRCLSVGLGLCPHLTGKGLGLAFVEAGLDFARQQFAPESFRMFVLAWNQRAIKVYERTGFTQVRTFVQRNIHGENEFIELRRPV